MDISLAVVDTFAPRIVTAFQAQYPTVTSGLANDAAIKAVLIQFIKSTVSTYEAQQAVAPAQQQAQQLAQQWPATYANQEAQTTTDVGANVT